MSPEFLVSWEIELGADSPRDAARRAREIQLDPSNYASKYEVKRMETNDTDWQAIDLFEEDDDQEGHHESP